MTENRSSENQKLNGASSQQTKAANTGNSGHAVTEKQAISTSAHGSEQSKSTQKSLQSTDHAKHLALASQLNDVLATAEKLKWQAQILEIDGCIVPVLKPPSPHVIAITGSDEEPIITVNGEAVR